MNSGQTLSVAASRTLDSVTNNGGVVSIETNGVTLTTNFIQQDGETRVAAGGTLTDTDGVVTISGGELQNNGGGTISSAVSVSGGTLAASGGTFGGNVSISGTGMFNVSGPTAVDTTTITGGDIDVGSGHLLGTDLVQSGGTTTINSGGTLTDADGTTLTGGTIANSGTISNAITVNGGTLTNSTGGRLSGLTTVQSGTLNASGGTFDGGVTAQGGMVNVTTSQTLDLTNNGSVININTGVDLTDDLVNNGGTLNIAGTLTGDLTNSATTNVTGTITGNVINNSSLIFSRSDAFTYGGVISGTGVLTQSGAGTLTLTGSNTHSGGSTISAGTLQIGNGGTTGSLSGDVTNNSALVFNRSDALNYAGAMSGTGSLTKSGAGTLTLTGSNTHTGGSTISAGTLQIGNGGTTGSLSGDVTNNSALVFNRSDALNYTGAMSGTGSLTKSGAGTLTLTGSNTHTGGTTISAGTLQIGNGGNSGSLSGNITNNSALIFNRSDALTYAGVISGTGSLTKSGAGTLTLAGTNTYSGGTTVSAGRLVVNGSVGAVTLSGGSLGGSGTIGGLTASSGSTIAPGNSIGTLNVTGNAALVAGSTYEVEVDSAGNADKLAATGTVTIDNGATVSILAENGTDDGSTYAPSTTYTIITAGTAVTGTFGTVTDNFAFLNAALDYGAKDVTLTLTRNAATFASVGRTANQRAVAHGVSSLSAGNAVYNAVVGLSADGARTAFDRLSGEIYPSINGQLLEDSSFVRDAVGARVLAPEEETGAWAQAYGNWEQSQGDGNASEMNRLLGETLFGADAIVWNGWRAGVLAGYSKSGFSAGDVASEADADSYILGGYASGAFGPVSVQLGTSFTLHDVSSSRTANVGGLSEELTADYLAGAGQVFGEVSYRLDTPSGNFEPYAGLALLGLHNAGFRENGGAAALTGSSFSQAIGVTTVGVRGMHVLSADNDVTAALTGGIEWLHVIGDDSAQNVMHFAGGNAFTISGTSMEQDRLQLEAGLNLEFSRVATLGLGYQGTLGSAVESHGITARLLGTF